MTVQNPIVKNVYRGNGSTTVFPYTFALNDTDGQYVKVLIADENDIETAVENFSVDTEAKTVTYPTSGEPLPEGYKIVLRRALPYTQELNLENQGPFFADDIEAELDRIVMQVQQQDEQLERAVKVQASSDVTADELLADIYAKHADTVASAQAAAEYSANADAKAEAAEASKIAAAESEANAAASAAKAEAIVDPQMLDRKISTHNTAANAHSNGLENPLRLWAAGTTYATNNIVVQDKKIWMCTTPNSDVVFDKAKWENIGGGGGLPLGFIFWTSAPVEMEGVLVADGATVSRAMYPDYNEQQAKLNYPWGAGDASTTFNLPNLIGRFAEGAENAGGYHSAGLPNITGEIKTSNLELIPPSAADVVVSGALSIVNATSIGQISAGSTKAIGVDKITFDASRSNPIYGNSDTVQPPSALLIPYVVVFTEQTADSAMIDVTQYAQELATQSVQISKRMDLERDFTVIYPNGGTAENPAEVTVDSRYIMDNPFSGYEIHCVAEIFVNGVWGDSGWIYASGGYGTNASFSNGSVVVQTGGKYVGCNAQDGGGAFPSAQITTAPCRVKVWKIGKVVSA